MTKIDPHTMNAKALRALVTADHRWPDYMRKTGENSATVSKSTLIDLGTAWGLFDDRDNDADPVTGSGDATDLFGDDKGGDDKGGDDKGGDDKGGGDKGGDDKGGDDKGDTEDDAELEAAKRALEALAKRKPTLDEEAVKRLIAEHGSAPPTVKLQLDTGAGFEPQDDALMHHRYPLLLTALGVKLNVMLVGPAGSGKTTAAEDAAKTLGLNFEFTGAVASEYKLTGFIDAQGRIVSTAFRRAYTEGGVFLFDETDASSAAALLAFNAALANSYADFPDGKAERHPDFRAIAAANTFGRGADRQYVGRAQLDAATLDRWVMLDWGYDLAVEAALVGQPRPEGAPTPPSILPVEDDAERRGIAAGWLARVNAVRRAVETTKTRLVVSPRATMHGAKLLCAGWPHQEVEDAVLWKGLDVDSRRKVEAEAKR